MSHVKPNYSPLPPKIAGQLHRYLEQGIRPEPFIEAVLCNDLVGAIKRGGPGDLQNLSFLICWIEENFPKRAWGSAWHMNDWIKSVQRARQRAAA